ncbi:MAG TPA: hypothetical protein VH134_16735 [Candidatus Dormibacteraeota bacterium]|nr:hypothetical protein [Candidatus Dormibacteraeota bacterium]
MSITRPTRTATQRRGQCLHLSPWPAAVSVTTLAVRATIPPRVHPVTCPSCAFDGGEPDAPFTSEPTAAWQRGMRPISL